MEKIVTFNRDKNYSYKQLERHTGPDSLAVSSMFYTLQGEGPYTGYPAVFLRLAGCNFGSKEIACQFCDTSFGLDNSTTFSIDGLRTSLLDLIPYSVPALLVVTGGEPTLQVGLIKLLELLQQEKKFHAYQVETNGTQSHFWEAMKSSSVDLDVICSPKATVRGYAELPPSLLQYMVKPDACSRKALKFVVSADPDSVHHTLPDWIDNPTVSSIPIYVSPMTVYKRDYSGEVSSIWDATLVDHEATAANYSYAAKLCLERGYLLSLQTHLFTQLP